MSELFESMAKYQAREQERMRIISILSDKICLDKCQHAVCRELTHTIREINRGRAK
jgi:hypothetical protein